MKDFLLLWGIILVFSSSGLTQNESDVKISASYNKVSLDLVMLNLEINHQLEFEYEESDIKDVIITASFKKQPLPLALAILLNGSGLGYEIEGKRKVTLFPESERKPKRSAPLTVNRRDFGISGVIKDGQTGETLPFANVLVLGTSIAGSSNVDGFFSLFNIPSDTVLLQVSYVGYQNLIFQLMPDMDMEALELDMSVDGVNLSQVVISATKEGQMLNASTGIGRISISPIALAQIPSYGEKDVFRSLQLLPGISGSNESSSGLYVRGGTPDQNLVLFDGFTVYHVDHLFGFFSAFNANAIKDVQLYKGGFESKFGGRISSVVDMTGKDGNTEELNMGFGISMLSFNGFVESPFLNGKGSVLIAGRRSFQSGFYSNIFDSYTEANETSTEVNQNLGRRFAQQEVQPTTYFYDLNAKISYRFSDDDILSLSFYNGEDNLDNSRNVDQNSFNRFFGDNSALTFNQENTDLTNWGNYGSSLKYSHRWNNKMYSNANISYSNYFSQRDQSDVTNIVRNDSLFANNRGTYENNDLRDVSFKLDNEYKISQNNQLDFGWQTVYNNIEYIFTQNDTNTIIDRQDKGVTNSLYLNDRHVFNDKFITKAGLRASHYSVSNKLYIEPRLHMTYLLDESIKLKAATGQYYQFANRIIREDIQQGSRDFWILADDETVPISSAWHYIIGASYEVKDWLFDVEGYVKDLSGLSEYSSRYAFSGTGRDRVLEYEESFYTGDGMVKGIDFLIQRKTGKLTGWLSYTLGEVKYDFPELSAEPFYANQDVRHELKLVGSYQYKSFDFGMTFIYASGRPYSAPTGFYEIELLDGSTSDYFEISDKNGLRFDPYHRLDLSATYNFKLGTSKANIGLSMFNVYNRNNTWYNEYDIIEGEILETKVSLLGLTPSLFFNWTLR
ncbi:TonB-dependent receptor [Membranihabitans marinus]|uniref:TonB-dependent receptor n=1 Tax=Membranihabitans marinus TaxID=1227546 RepID=UPI001F364E86|nr:TonB-dependent receptor [Membranihabitans marinus]